MFKIRIDSLDHEIISIYQISSFISTAVLEVMFVCWLVGRSVRRRVGQSVIIFKMLVSEYSLILDFIL